MSELSELCKSLGLLAAVMFLGTLALRERKFQLKWKGKKSNGEVDAEIGMCGKADTAGTTVVAKKNPK